MELRDRLPNLQIMEGLENISKNCTPFKHWLSGKDNNNNHVVPDRNKFLMDNYIDLNQSLDFIDFEAFYSKRKDKLEYELKILLK
jgi:hypothetical protein